MTKLGADVDVGVDVDSDERGGRGLTTAKDRTDGSGEGAPRAAQRDAHFDFHSLPLWSLLHLWHAMTLRAQPTWSICVTESDRSSTAPC